MTLEIINCVQGSDEWKQHKCGIASASCFKDILAKGKGISRKNYLLKLVGERITGQPAESYSNAHTERGTELEPIARSLYVEQTFNDVLDCGFMKNWGVGYSPDGLIGNDGLIEIKCKLAHLQAEVLLGGEVPNEHMAQIQGGLWVSERKWLDFVSYCPGMPLFIKRVERDELYIMSLREELASFEIELAATVSKIKAMAA